MENYLEPVKEFMKMMDHPVLSTPTIPDHKRCELRYSLIKEELEELKVAYESGDLVGVLDALCDLQYVLSGAVLEFGMPTVLQPAFCEVQRSNLTKRCLTPKEAMDTIAYYREKGVEAYFLRKDDYYLVYRASDDKVLKSINYSPANLKQFINE
jgi:predicted HAD superfamily Cof-like phosphohydrolase